MEKYYRYWGKTAEDGSYHLLPYHCLDVAAVGWLLLAPKRTLTTYLSKYLGVQPEWLRRWFSFCLTIHDIGKFATSFQGLKPELDSNLVSAISSMPYSERHDSLGFLLWQKVLRPCWADSGSNSALHFSAQHLRGLEPWLRIVAGHHGIPPKEVLGRYQEFFTEADELAAKTYCSDISQILLTEFDAEPLADRSFRKKLQRSSWALAGMTVLADWLGSSISPEQYCSTPQPLADYWHENALPQAERLVSSAQLTPQPATPFTGIRTLFPFINQPTPLQSWAETVAIGNQPQLFICEDMTGAGKTEAALTLCHRLIAAAAAEGIYVGLPTMATANAMYLRLGKAYRRLYASTAKPSLILAHGARHLSDTFRDSIDWPNSATNAIDYDKGESSGEAYCHAWLADSRKKALLADVGVGTLDQALLSVLPARHQSLRLLGLSRKILLIDEVHAYDPYMNALLQTLLQAHAASGGSAILLSATLPQQMRKSYVQAFCSGLDCNLPVLTDNPTYPLTTHIGQDFCAEKAIAPRQEVARSTKIDWLTSEQEVLELIEQQVKAERCVCWIRNTIGDARNAFDVLEQCEWMAADKLSLFHSRFAMLDRQRIEAQTLECFGDQSTAEIRRGRVLIATQVVEQSLDLDFDILISDLAPIDLLVQRAGREHRHIRDEFGNRIRQTGATDRRDPPVFYLLAPRATDQPEKNWLKAVLPGTQAVYRHVGQLWLTQQILLKEQQIDPLHNARVLIESVFGDAYQYLIPDALQELSWDAEGDASSKRGIAYLNQLDLNKGYSRSSAEDSGGWDEDTNIPTRLSEQTVDVAFVVERGGQLVPYAQVGKFPWDLSSVSLPRRDWEQLRSKISQPLQARIEALKETEKVLKWKEVVPLIDDLSHCYDQNKGWSLNQGGQE